MAHCGYEPTAVLATMGSLKESLRALTGAQRGKIKEAEMACTCACDKACTCDCCGQRGTRAARSELDDVRAQVTRLEAELADRKPASS
jgi:hypothetical protein